MPAKYSLLRAVRIPSKGGNTEFAHMGAAYEALDDETKELIEDLVCEHSQLFSRETDRVHRFTPEERERFKPVRQRLVRTLPRTGRKSIYLSSHAGHDRRLGVAGSASAAARSDRACDAARVRLFAQWQVDDLVIWDNRQTMHRGRPYPANEARDVRRTTMKGDAPTIEQALAA